MSIKNESKLDLKNCGLLLDCGENFRYYKLCEIYKEDDVSRVKYSLYTNLDELKAINFDSNGNVNKVVFMNAKNIEDVLARKKYWQKRLKDLEEYKSLSKANLECYKKEILKEKINFFSTLLGTVAFSYGIGNSTYNYAQSEEAGKLLWSFMIAGFSFEYCRIFFEEYWNKISIENLSKNLKMEDLKKEMTLFLNYDLPIALYYNILFECLEETPNKEKIQILNNERKKILKKDDCFSTDVEKFIRVR